MTALLTAARAWVDEVHPHARHLLRTEDWAVTLDPGASDALTFPSRVTPQRLSLPLNLPLQVGSRRRGPPRPLRSSGESVAPCGRTHHESSLNWSGAYIPPHDGELFTLVFAQWQVPP